MGVQSEWWRTFFTGPAVDLWINAVSPEHTAAELAYLVTTLAIRPGARVLDVACGAGRIANGLAARGFAVVGVDISPEFLRHAKESDPDGRVEWHERDMRDLPWRDMFDGVVCAGNSFGYLDDDGNEAFVDAIARVLKPGSRALLVTHAVAESVLAHMERRTWIAVDRTLMLADHRYDHDVGRLETTYTFVAGGALDVRDTTQRIYTYRQLREMVESAGMRVVRADTLAATSAHNPYRDGRFETVPFGIGAGMLMLTMQRRG